MCFISVDSGQEIFILKSDIFSESNQETQMQTDCFYPVIIFMTVKEISRMEIVSTFYRKAFNNEKIRKKIVSRNFGVEVLCGSTWKETSIILTKDKMINLNKMWAGSMTYSNIIDNVEDIPVNRFFFRMRYLRELQVEHYPCKEAKGGGYWDNLYSDNLMEVMEKDQLKREMTGEEKNDFKDIFTREFLIIYYSVFECEKDIYADLLTELRSFSRISVSTLILYCAEFF